MRKLYRPLVGSAPRASKVAPKQPHPPPTIASPSTTLAPTPRHQRLTTVGGWCDTIIQPFLSRFSSRRFSFQAFLCHKKPLDGKIWYFGPKTSSEHTTKWAPLGPLKPSIPRSTRRVRAHIPIEQPTTVTLSVRGCLGGCLARGVQGSSAEGRPIRFVPSVWYKRQKLLKFEHIHAKLTMTLDAPPGDTVMGAWDRRS